MSNKLKTYIKIQQDKKIQYLVFNRVPIYIKNKLPEYFNIVKFVKALENTLPFKFSKIINSIIFLESDIFLKKQINAFYNQKNIYVSNKQDNISDAIDDVVHEYAHALEEKYGESIYSDDLIKNEFLFKRHHLERIIRNQGFDTISHDFKNINFDKKLDNFLLNVVGYEKFNKLTNYGLFVNPYAATSLREYFATGFEEYLLGDSRELKKISPNLYIIIGKIIK
jgi:hypothetical protein